MPNRFLDVISFIVILIFSVLERNGGSGEIVLIILADKSLILIVAVNDKWRQVFLFVGLVNQVQGLIVDWVHVIINCDGTFWGI